MISGTYENSVFLNCPFDPAYRPLFEAVVFAVYDCGFLPRCALEVDDSSQVRIEKLIAIIDQCRLAIHEISRTELDPAHLLPRFNIPFELGLFVGSKAFGGADHRRKACMVLDSERYRFQKFISDIAGQDVREHNGRPAAAVHQVRDFLSGHVTGGAVLPGGRVVAARYQAFRRQLPGSCGALRLDRRRLTFRDLTTLITAWIETHPLPHHASAGAAGRVPAGGEAR